MNWRNRKPSESILLILVASLALYVLGVAASVKWYSANVPQGDAFTYATGFYQLLDGAHKSLYAGWLMVFLNPWRYWVQPTLVLILSPMLVKAPFSVMLINYVIFTLSTYATYLFYLRISKSEWLALLLGFLFWLWPTFFGFPGAPDVNLLSLNIDFVYLQTLSIAICAALMFAFEPMNLKLAIWCGISVALAVWGRGNSLPYVGLALFVPGLSILRLFWTYRKSPKDRNRLFLNLTVLSFVSIALISWFYDINLASIRRYYSAAVSSHALLGESNLALKSLVQYYDVYVRMILGEFRYLNMHPKTSDRILLSLLSVLPILGCFFYSFRFHAKLSKQESLILRTISLTGAFIFFGIFFSMTLILRVQLTVFGLAPFLPMVLGFDLVLASSLLKLFWIKREIFETWNQPLVARAIALLFIMFGGFWTMMPNSCKVCSPILVTGKEMELFAIGIDQWAPPKKFAFLWYNVYNRSILSFYRLQNSKKIYEVYENSNYDALWIPAIKPDVLRISEALDQTFKEAEFILMPEKLKCYATDWPYPLYQSVLTLEAYLKSHTNLPYVIRDRLPEAGDCNLVILQKIDANKDCHLCEPLKIELTGLASKS